MTSAQKMEIAIAALREIANPIKAMNDRLKPDEVLDTGFAIMLSKDPGHLSGIARQALGEINQTYRKDGKPRGPDRQKLRTIISRLPAKDPLMDAVEDWQDL